MVRDGRSVNRWPRDSLLAWSVTDP